MCGVFAMFMNRPLTGADLQFGRTATADLRHRGPDGEGEWYDIDAGVYLGHRRLAIIDLTEASSQPMVRGDHVLSYNGETYNYPELRRRLTAKGVSLRTMGDTEVMLEGLKTWGAAFLQELDAMFALALWDGERGMVAVDPFGEKPLYYAELQDGVVFCSELAPLVAHVSAAPRQDSEFITEFLALGYVRAPQTAYEKIGRLPAATVMEIRKGRIRTSERYWSPTIRPPADGKPVALQKAELDRLQEALVDSLSGRLIADVPMCLFLSGGVDSSLIAAIAKRDLGKDLDCITVSFSGTEDEAPMARETAELLDLPFRRLSVDTGGRKFGPSDIVGLFGQPCEASTILSISHMTGAAASEYKVGLTGSGGDEIFFGYGKHAHFYKYRRFHALPDRLRAGLATLARLARPMHSSFVRLADDLLVPRREIFLADKNFPAIDWLRQMSGFRQFSEELFGNTRSAYEEAALFEIVDAMPNSRLIAMDHGSMSNSMELRTPFLSRRVVDAIASVDPRALFAFGQKAALRSILERYLPSNIANRKKQGFFFPVDWLIDTEKLGQAALPGVSVISQRQIADELGNGLGWRRLAVKILLLASFYEMATGRHPPTIRNE